MEYKKSMVIIILIFLASITCVCAGDVNDTLAASENTTNLEMVQSDEMTVAADDCQSLDMPCDEQTLGVSDRVNKDNFFDYFNESGMLRSDITSDELIFEGEFNDMGVDNITIVKPITLTSSHAFLDGISFVINSDNVTIDGFSITQTDCVAISANGDNIVISNNFIDFTAKEGNDSYAIYSLVSSNLQLLNNNIVYMGTTDGTVVNNAVRIEGDGKKKTPASSIVVSGNYFDINLPSVATAYDLDTYKTKYMSECIAFYCCNDIQFTDNTVNVKYTVASGDYDTLYAVSVRGDAYSNVHSSDVLIANNTILLEGHSCAYGIYLCADDFEISENNITVTANEYLAYAIVVEGPSDNGTVADNEIAVASPVASRGLYSYAWMGAVRNVSITDNTISAKGYASAGIELKGSDPTVTRNTIVVEGNYTYGIIASVIKEEKGGMITRNDVTVLGYNVGERDTDNQYMSHNSVGISARGDCLIENNTVSSTSIGISLSDNGDITLDKNNITVEANTGRIDNHAILASEISNLVISNNQIAYAGASEKNDDENARAYAIYVSDSKADVKGNTINISVPSVPDCRTDDGEGNPVRQSYGEGLVFDGCDQCYVRDNEIILSHNKGGNGSVYVIDVSGCDDFTVSGNSIDAAGENHICAIIIKGNGFKITDNLITASSEYKAVGIDIENSAGGIVDSNIIKTTAPAYAYSIYGGMPDTLSAEIVNNEIHGDSYFAVGIELSGSNVGATDNSIQLSGNHTIGIGVNADELAAFNNTIICDASNVGNVSVSDTIAADTIGIKSLKGNVAVIDNSIITTGRYSVDIADANGTVHDNFLLSEELKGDESVSFTGKATVYDNYFKKLILEASDLEMAYGDGQPFRVTARDYYGNPLKNMTLTAQADGKYFNATTGEGGVAAFDIRLAGGSYPVTTQFPGNGLYGRAFIKNYITVTAMKTEIIPANHTVELCVGDGFKLDYIFNPNNAPGNVTFKSSNSSIAMVDLNTGLVSAQGKGTANITIDYAGNENYTASNATVKIRVYNARSTLTVSDIAFNYNQTGASEVSFTNASGVTASVVNHTEAVINVTANAITVTGLDVGTYTLRVTTITDDDYMPVTKEATITVNKTKTELKANAVTATYNKNKNLVITLKDTDGNALTGVSITVKIVNTKTYTTDKNGQVKINVAKLAPKTYTAKITFNGNANYDKTTKDVKVKVKKAKAKIIAKKKTFKAKKKVKKYKIKLKNNKGKPIKKAKVTLKIKKKTYKAKTNKKGKATFKIKKLNKKGKYKATIKYKGNKYYKKTTKKVKIKIK